MENLNLLEDKYLKAKIAYYEGNPIMSDAEFDVLEDHLRSLGSKVIEQVGSKRKDFNFPHPSRMLSLSKIQTEACERGIDYKENDFIKWFKKNINIIGKIPLLEASPKFDGNAINIIYHGNKLLSILTRGDGIRGKDITKKMSIHVPQELILSDLNVNDNDIIEIRAEVVIDVSIFNEKYSSEFANARNYVAGVIGMDDIDDIRVSELKVIPLHFILNGKHVNWHHFKENKEFSKNWNISFVHNDYVKIIKSFEDLRKGFNYRLDGVVISFPTEFREILGENEHDPEWSIAIKFVPVETITEVKGVEWNVSKKGEIIPTVLLSPVFLDGSKVSRASGYNAGYIINKGIGIGAKVSLAKSGDIIPEIQKVIIETQDPFVLPDKCPACGDKLSYDGVHLMCTNSICEGKIAKQLATAISILDVKGVGEKTIEPFSKRFKDIYEVIKFVLSNPDSLDEFGFEIGSKSHQNFVNAFRNIKSISYYQVIQMLGYENVGKKLAIQLAREHAGLDYNYMHLERAIVEKLRSREVSNYIKEVVKGLEDLGISVDRPKSDDLNKDIIGVCLTGSPKNFGYSTKSDFLAKFPRVKEVSISDPLCKYLVTDSYDSESSKMKNAKKNGIKIVTYGDFNDLVI
ncbi:MAG TPA: hypothetical protein P5513_07860 [Candidatus Diapherotrites archaeon]|nr:hypothetical protein [Candidatus Diapherotrites archaeon]